MTLFAVDDPNPLRQLLAIQLSYREFMRLQVGGAFVKSGQFFQGYDESPVDTAKKIGRKILLDLFQRGEQHIFFILRHDADIVPVGLYVNDISERDLYKTAGITDKEEVLH